MKEFSPKELKQKIDAKDDFQLIDIREAYEYEICNLNGELIPLDKVLENIKKIRKDVPVVFHCRTGGRAKAIVDTLERIHQLNNLYSLEGGIIKYAQDIDNNLQQY